MQPLAEIGQFRQSYTAPSRRKLPLPMASGLRVAQVSARGLLYGEAQYFPLDQHGVLQAFRPQVLIGSATELVTLARRATEGVVDLSSLDRALFVITDCRDVPLRDTSRVVLWQAFGVPIYELLLGGDGTPIASECEAHEGWHAEDGVTFSTVNGELWFQRRRDTAQGTGLVGNIEDAACPCGKSGKRILNAAIDYRDPVRHYLAQTA
jgi:hypothetical protein